jgi:hypothetical protein
MQIIQGGKQPDPEPVEDTFLEEIIITALELNYWFNQGQLTLKQHFKLSQEVPHSNN